MANPEQALRAVLNAACACLADAKCAGTDALVQASNGPITQPSPIIPAHATLLDTAISAIDTSRFANLQSALIQAKPHLHWKVDDGGYYPPGADVGHGYKSGNMHALFVGPQNAPLLIDDMLLGVFLLAPWTLYRDHKHAAPEVYIPLTGPSGWRFEAGPWQDHDAGDVIFNAPNHVHATRVYDTPFLALFAWTTDIASQCSVVPTGDWDALETRLGQQLR